MGEILSLPNMSGNASPHEGFIALMSAIIISAVLMLVVISGGLTGFFARANIFDAELKARSEAVADACLDQALLLIANNPAYVDTAPQIFIFNSLDSCRLRVTDPAPNKTIRVQATSTPAVTNLSAAYNTTSHSFTSLKEEAVY
jgi:hypothetical protein